MPRVDAIVPANGPAVGGNLVELFGLWGNGTTDVTRVAFCNNGDVGEIVFQNGTYMQVRLANTEAPDTWCGVIIESTSYGNSMSSLYYHYNPGTLVATRREVPVAVSG